MGAGKKELHVDDVDDESMLVAELLGAGGCEKWNIPLKQPAKYWVAVPKC